MTKQELVGKMEKLNEKLVDAQSTLDLLVFAAYAGFDEKCVKRNLAAAMNGLSEKLDGLSDDYIDLATTVEHTEGGIINE